MSWIMFVSFDLSLYNINPHLTAINRLPKWIVLQLLRVKSKTSINGAKYMFNCIGCNISLIIFNQGKLEKNIGIIIKI